uniref:PiggyBac transposable element-derived protein domain-containing protein n=1 Tax=Acrobeloides nanus TaxID=290746 RepID=A0A914CW82_9BILA
MDSLNVLDYDPDEIALSEEFDDYFDLSEDEEEGLKHRTGPILTQIENAKMWTKKKLYGEKFSRYKTSMIMVDSTYKCTYSGHPVRVVGWSDFSKRFFPTAISIMNAEDAAS